MVLLMATLLELHPGYQLMGKYIGFTLTSFRFTTCFRLLHRGENVICFWCILRVRLCVCVRLHSPLSRVLLQGSPNREELLLEWRLHPSNY